MAFIANVKIKNKKSKLSKIIKAILLVIVAVAIAVWGAILYFNGQNIKAPLIKFLSSRTSFEINCQKVEFSALYPNVIKLHDIKIGKSNIDEIYMEYDLPSLLKSNTFEIKYFYAKGIKADDKDIQTLKQEKFKFKDIHISKLDLVDTPINLYKLSLNKGSLSAVDAYLANDGKFSFKVADVKASEGVLDEQPVKNLQANISVLPEKVVIKDLSLQIFGGTLLADLTVDRKTEALNFSRLNLNKIIFKDYKLLSKKYNIYAPEASVYDCVLALPKQDLLFGQIRGALSDLLVKDGSINFTFKGSSGEISKPSIQVTAENSDIEASITDNSISMKADGTVFDGSYSFDGKYDYQNENEPLLTIHNLSLKEGKFETTKEQYAFVRNILLNSNLNVEKLNIDGTEFVSFINTLPLSIKSVKLEANNISFNNKAKEENINNTLDQNNFDVKLDVKEVAQTKDKATTNNQSADDTAVSKEDDDNYPLLKRLSPLNSILSSSADNDEDSSTSYITFSFDSAYYSDLFIKQFDSKLDLTDKGYAFNVGKMLFKKSELAFEIDADKELELSRFKIFAPKFDISELNSNLTDHLLSGVINLEGEIVKNEDTADKANKSDDTKASASNDKSQSSDNKTADNSSSNNNNAEIKDTDNSQDKVAELYSGNIKLTSDSLLVSQFGLDLVNGGLKKNYALNFTQFLDAIKDGDLGLYKLSLNIFPQDNFLKLKGSGDLTTSHLTFNAKLDLKTKDISARGTFVSLPKDSISNITIKGLTKEDTNDKNIFITALSRGEIRPGINEDVIDENKAKEMTDAASELNKDKDQKGPEALEKSSQDL
ncbi:MAG: hypothetical protein IJ254_07030 [Succinivibrio sp.]|jgi:hypothetical protein|nr:hypothetical protein [Succinivibrio sp.]